jgi:hypothetical protein
MPFQKGQSAIRPAGRAGRAIAQGRACKACWKGRRRTACAKCADVCSEWVTKVRAVCGIGTLRRCTQGKAHPDDRFFYVSWRR